MRDPQTTNYVTVDSTNYLYTADSVTGYIVEQGNKMATNQALSELYGGPLQLRPSIFLHIEEGLRGNPNGLATVVVHQSPEHLSELWDGKSSSLGTSNDNEQKCLAWTYTQLHRAALKFADGLMRNGIRPGMRIAILIPNRVEYPLVLWACAILKLTFCGFDPAALSPTRSVELQNLLVHIQPDVIVVLDSTGANAVDAALSTVQNKSPKVKIVLEGSSIQAPKSGWTTIPNLVFDGGAPNPIDERETLEEARRYDPDRYAYILFTSGTSSGTPKGCPTRVAAVAHALDARKQTLGLSSTTRSLVSTTNFRVISPMTHLATWKAGGVAIIPGPAADPSYVLSAIQDQKITSMVLVPASLHGLVAHSSFQHTEVSSVKGVRLGGDIITRDLYDKTARSFPQAEISVGHGMTETGGTFGFPYSKTQAHIPYFGDICPIGEILPGVRVKIRDPETGSVTKRGETGELCLCSKGTIEHYLGDINKDSFFEDEQGRWFRTGDLAMIDHNNVAFILGRLKDIIKRAGIPITPAALESCVERFVDSQVCPSSFPSILL